MPNLVLEELVLVSRTERQGRILRFHPRWNMLVGRNGGGKSSLLKALFWTMGAKPALVTKAWKSANVEGMVQFTVGDRRYQALRRGDEIAMFLDGDLIGNYESLTTGFGPEFARAVEFGLVLPDRATKQAVTPPPVYYFLPYYVDQDKGWANLWGSFSNLGQFNKWQNPVLDYHLGLRPNSWYSLAAEMQAQRELENHPLSQIAMLNSLVDDIEKLLNTIPVDLDIEAFQASVVALRSEVKSLHSAEQKVLRRLAEVHRENNILEAQVQILEKAIGEFSADFEFATTEVGDHAECPTCGMVYHNDFASRFAIAHDEQKCVDLRGSLRIELRKLEQERGVKREELAQVRLGMEALQERLGQKVGEITLDDLARAKGKQELLKVARSKIEALEVEVGAIRAKISSLAREKGELESSGKKKRAELKSNFAAKLRVYGRKLDVGEWASSIPNSIPTKIDVGGSEGTRAVLAWTLAFYRMAAGQAGCATPPLVIDSPKQQDISEEIWAQIFELIRSEFPRDRQLILASREGEDLFDPDFCVRFTDKRTALVEEEFEGARQRMYPFTKQVDRL